MSYREIQLLVWTPKIRNLLGIYIAQEVYILRKLFTTFEHDFFSLADGK